MDNEEEANLGGLENDGLALSLSVSKEDDSGTLSKRHHHFLLL